MIGDTLNKQFGFKRGLGYNTSVFNTVVISRGGTVTAAELNYLTTFENNLDSDINLFDRLYIHGLTNNIAARTSFVKPAAAIITAVNTPTFTASQGYAGNGTTSYLNSNYNPNVDGTNFTLNNASFGIYSRTNSNITAVDIGLYNTTMATQIRLREIGFTYSLLNDLTGAATSLSDSLSLFACTRNGSTQKIYKRGVEIATGTAVSTVLSNVNFFIGARNNSGTADEYSTRQFALSFMGAGTINQANFYNAVQTLGTSIGWAV